LLSRSLTFAGGKWFSLLPEDVMSSSLRWLASLVLLLSAAPHVWADACLHNPFVRRETPWERLRSTTPDPEHDLVIVRDASVKEAELRIPRRMMAADASAPGSATRTMMVGVALSAAFVGGGLWCLRFRPREIPRKKLLIGAAVIVVLYAGLTLVSFSEANPPEPPIRIVLPTVQLGDIAVNVRIVDQGGAVELALPPELADKIAAR
jgi:hypothetical protein